MNLGELWTRSESEWAMLCSSCVEVGYLGCACNSSNPQTHRWTTLPNLTGCEGCWQAEGGLSGIFVKTLFTDLENTFFTDYSKKVTVFHG